MSAPGPFTFPTVSGVRFDLAKPDPADVRIGDIAHSLARICRYGGHVAEHYSVAQHSVEVWERLAELRCPPDVQVAGLLHDAAEAYVGDVIRPLKRLIGETYKAIESSVSAAIFDAFGIARSLVDHASVREADMFLYAWERRDLAPAGGVPIWDVPALDLPESRLTAWDAEQAERVFVSIFEQARPCA